MQYRKIPLSEYVSQKGQQKVAQLFGIRQCAISKALARGRNINVIEYADGSVRGEEIKAFPSKPN